MKYTLLYITAYSNEDLSDGLDLSLWRAYYIDKNSELGFSSFETKI